jgi:hypothetical protein
MEYWFKRKYRPFNFFDLDFCIFSETHHSTTPTLHHSS